VDIENKVLRPERNVFKSQTRVPTSMQCIVQQYVQYKEIFLHLASIPDANN